MINFILLIILLIIAWVASMKLVAISILNLVMNVDFINIAILGVSIISLIVVFKLFLTKVIMRIIL